MRELDAHNRGAYTIQELRRMYDSIIKDIDKEIKKIFNTYKSTVYKELHADHETGAADNK